MSAIKLSRVLAERIDECPSNLREHILEIFAAMSEPEQRTLYHAERVSEHIFFARAACDISVIVNPDTAVILVGSLVGPAPGFRQIIARNWTKKERDIYSVLA